MSKLIRAFYDDWVEIYKNSKNELAIIVDDDVNEIQFTYNEVNELVDRCICLFNECGLKEGDIILSQLPNSVESIICLFSVLKAGYGYAPIPCNATKNEIKKAYNLFKPKICIRRKDIIYEDNDFSDINKPQMIDIICDGKFNWVEELKKDVTVNRGMAKIYLSTSGTTGEPKGIVIDGNTLWSSGYSFSKVININKMKPRFWNYLPMSYLGGIFNLGIIPICCQGSILITEPFSGKTFLDYWEIIKRYDVDSIWLVPTIIKGLISIAERLPHKYIKDCAKQIKISLLGTAPIELKVKTKFEEMFGITLLENYALSETTFLTTELMNNIKKRTESSVGEILPYVDMKFLPNIDFNEGIFDIWVKTPFMFDGYLYADGNISLDIDNEGYFKTGDMGYLDNNGIVKLEGRRQDIIKKGGQLIVLKEIENIINEYKNVQECSAVKVKHDYYGESYKVYVVFTNKMKNNINGLSAYIHKQLIRYKWPEEIIEVDELEKTKTGKIIKR